MRFKNKFMIGFLKKAVSIGLAGLIAITFTVVALPTPAHAAPADAYWVGDGGNWSDAATHWAIVSDGAPGAGNLPDATSNVHFDANSFTLDGQTVTLDVTAIFLDMDWTGATNTPTLHGDIAGRAMNASGSVTFISAMDITVTGYMILNIIGTCTLTTNGLILPLAITMGGIANVTLGDALTMTGGVPRIELQVGTFNTANYDITLGFLSLTAAGVKTVTLGSSTINITGTGGDGTGSGWNYIGTNLTLTANTSTIKVAGTGTFKGGGITTYNNVELNGTAHTISGANTFNTLTFAPATTQTITFTDGTTQTVTTANITGVLGNVKTLQGSGAGGWAITKAGGGTVLLDYMSISRSTGNPATTWYGGGNSTDGLNNTNWFFNDQPLTITTQGPSNENLNGTLGALVGTHNTSTWMEYGLTTAYGSTTLVVVRITTGAFEIPYPADFVNGRTYQYRFVGSNDSGTYNGNNQTVDFSGAGYLLLRAVLTVAIALGTVITVLRTMGSPILMLLGVTIGILAIIIVQNVIG